MLRCIVLLPRAVGVVGQHGNILRLGFAAIRTGEGLLTERSVRGRRGNYAAIPIVRRILHIGASAHALVLRDIVLLPRAVGVHVNEQERADVALAIPARIGMHRHVRAISAGAFLPVAGNITFPSVCKRVHVPSKSALISFGRVKINVRDRPA